MPENQEHGKTWEKDIALNVFGVTEEEYDAIPHTERNDIHGELNRLDKGTNISIKTTGGDTVCMADVSRMFENVGNGERYHMVVIMYKQNSKATKKLYRIIELDLTNSRELLFGTAPKDEINELVEYVKAIPKGIPRDVRAEHSATYLPMAKNIRMKNGGYISYAPKVDSEGQRRVQCCIPKFSKFVKEHPERVIYESQTGEFRGGTITEEIVSPPRQRNNNKEKKPPKEKKTQTPRQVEEIRLKKLKAGDLQKECIESGLSDKGKKKLLLARLLSNKFGDDGEVKKVVSIENVPMPTPSESD